MHGNICADVKWKGSLHEFPSSCVTVLNMFPNCIKYTQYTQCVMLVAKITLVEVIGFVAAAVKTNWILPGLYIHF